jgi:ABC-type tungstate transport system substrate-binding protein
MVCEGYPLAIPIGNGNYFCGTWTLAAIAATVILVPTLVIGYVLFGSG